MKTGLIILFLLMVAAIILFFVLGFISKSGAAPGLVDGTLSKCPNKPNCVCSENTDDSSHYIDPIVIPPSGAIDTLPMLKSVVQTMGGAIQTESEHYFAATFSSTVFGFVDDLEIRIDATKGVIHMRSASRVGYSDAGVNKKRTELLKKRYVQEFSTATQ